MNCLNKYFFLLALLPVITFAQLKKIPVKKQAYADLENALHIKDSVYGPVNVSMKYGKVCDFNNGTLKETNSAWFTFTVSYDTVLTFDIVPIDSCDDYEFILFKCNGNKCMNEIRTNLLKPEKECYYANLKCNRSIGLSKSSITNTNMAAHNLSAIEVKKGDTFFLLVDYAMEISPYTKDPSGFTIYFYNNWRESRKKHFSDILFESDKFSISKEYFPELNKLAALLIQNPGKKVELAGYTDHSGLEEKNSELSYKRAKAVKDYLIAKGVKQNQITFTGRGSIIKTGISKPEEAKLKSRRVEILLIN